MLDSSDAPTLHLIALVALAAGCHAAPGADAASSAVPTSAGEIMPPEPPPPSELAVSRDLVLYLHADVRPSKEPGQPLTGTGAIPLAPGADGRPTADAADVFLPDHVVPIFEKVPPTDLPAPSCTATFIHDPLLLTAAHCVDGPRSLFLGDPTGRVAAGVPLVFAPADRACMGRPSCALRRSRPDIPNDIAVLHWASGNPRADWSLRIGHVSGSVLPDMVLLGFRGEERPIKPRAVCGARIVESAGEVPIDPDTSPAVLGDSGGPLVAVDRLGKPIVLGIVSAVAAGVWYFTPAPERIDVPTSYERVLTIERFNSLDGFATVRDCAEGS